MTRNQDDIVIRPAVLSDADEILEMLETLAAFEGAAIMPRMERAELNQYVFGPLKALEILVAELPAISRTRRLAGLITWFPNFSTWEGRAGLHVGDLFVREELRRCGVATQLIERASSLTHGRVDVFVLKGNERAIQFYERRGFREAKEWTLFRRPASVNPSSLEYREEQS